MNSIIRHILILSIAAVLQSCEKEIDIEYHDIEPIVVIEGQLTQNGAEVRISMTTPMDEAFNGKYITDATVSITDISSGIEKTLTSDDDGIYIGNIAGCTGHLYELTVNRDGESYTAQCQMPVSCEITGLEFNWIKMPYDHVAVLQVSFTDNPVQTGDCYWVRLYRNGVAYKWDIVTDIHESDGIINNVFMTSRKNLDEEDDDTALREGDTMVASVSPISREMYEYLEAVSSNSNGPRLFSGDFCLGYFIASPTVASSIVFHPDEMTVY